LCGGHVIFRIGLGKNDLIIALFRSLDHCLRSMPIVDTMQPCYLYPRYTELLRTEWRAESLCRYLHHTRLSKMSEAYLLINIG
jgi:hypothetical protein